MISYIKLMLLGILILFSVWLGWRMVRPMNVFDVTQYFAKPIDTAKMPEMFDNMHSEECGVCHQKFLDEWKTSMHSQAWTDPYFQADWVFDGKQQICKNCHTPLDNQQELLVTGFSGENLTQPIFEPNPNFDPKLQHEGVTCAACHYRDGAILGPFGLDAPHPVQKLQNSNEICMRCHVAPETRPDVFVKFPLCGTVAELLENNASIKETISKVGAHSEIAIETISDLKCVECHMPTTERPLVDGGPVRPVRQHLWRGGHDQQTVKNSLDFNFLETAVENGHEFTLSVTNSGAKHYVPTGIPDRHLIVSLRFLDDSGNILKEEKAVLQRTFLWRPFIVQTSDTRLQYDETKQFTIKMGPKKFKNAVAVEAVVTYHLLSEKRRQRISYENENPISYVLFYKLHALQDKVDK